MANKLFISDITPWAPGFITDDDFCAWAKNEKNIPLEKTAPAISFTDALFRRRLSQISKMTIQVVHDLFEKNPSLSKETKIVFVSFRGELDREFKINKSLIEDKMILPAGFSLSVFNAPIALATIALKLTGGYDTIFPVNENFSFAFKMAATSVLSGDEKEIIFVYADELIPEVYSECAKIEEPFAFASVLSLEQKENAKQIDLENVGESSSDFLKSVLQNT